MDNTEPVKNTETVKARKTGPYLLSAILILLTVSLLLFASFISSESEKIASGTMLIKKGGIFESLGGLDLNQASMRVAAAVEEYTEDEIVLKSSVNPVKVRLKDAGITVNIQNIMGTVSECLYGSDVVESVKRHISFNRNISISDFIETDTKEMDKFIGENLSFIEKKPEDASLYVNDKGELEIKKEVSGSTLNRQKFEQQLISAAKSSDREMDIPTTSIPPQTDEGCLKKLMPTAAISTYTSNYSGSDEGRKENIRLGASLINNILLKPGEEFEFWKYVGDTTPSRGFRPAGVYENGKLVMGIGGGLCQVSTALYNAALLADLKITQRSPHSMPVSYVPLGLDATVSTGVHTLRFVNNTEKYILIKSSVDGNNIKIEIIGSPVEGKTVKVYSKVVSPKTADAYKDVYLNGKIIKHEYLGRSKYR